MKAIARHLRISPRKLRIVAGMVRGKSLAAALAFLHFTPKKAAGFVATLLKSAAANAKNTAATDNPDTLLVEKIYVTKGRTMRRGVPASRGRVAPLKKRQSHLFVELAAEKDAQKQAASTPAKAKKEAPSEAAAAPGPASSKAEAKATTKKAAPKVAKKAAPAKKMATKKPASTKKVAPKKTAPAKKPASKKAAGGDS